jgi:glutathione S-transferase
MDAKLVLYIGEKNVSSWSMRPWIALAHKGLAFEERAVRLVADRDAALRERVSPTGLVPVLYHGERAVPDSLAILEYLEEQFPAPRWPALWPAHPDARARARWLAAVMHSGFPEIRESMSFNLCFLPERPAASRAALAEARRLVALWESALAARCVEGPYLVGPFSGADVMFAPVVWRLMAFGVETSPTAAAYMRAVLAEPAVEAWLSAARRLPPVADE